MPPKRVERAGRERWGLEPSLTPRQHLTAQLKEVNRLVEGPLAGMAEYIAAKKPAPEIEEKLIKRALGSALIIRGYVEGMGSSECISEFSRQRVIPEIIRLCNEFRKQEDLEGAFRILSRIDRLTCAIGV